MFGYCLSLSTEGGEGKTKHRAMLVKQTSMTIRIKVLTLLHSRKMKHRPPHRNIEESLQETIWISNLHLLYRTVHDYRCAVLPTFVPHCLIFEYIYWVMQKYVHRVSASVLVSLPVMLGVHHSTSSCLFSFTQMLNLNITTKFMHAGPRGLEPYRCTEVYSLGASD